MIVSHASSVPNSARRSLLVAGAVCATAALATGAALASNASSKSFNWSTAKSAKAGGGKKALVKAAKECAEGKEGGPENLNKAANCGACHKEHKPA